jgi:hypothetical protein
MRFGSSSKTEPRFIELREIVAKGECYYVNRKGKSKHTNKKYFFKINSNDMVIPLEHYT